VAQAIAVAEAFERGLDRARAAGCDMTRLHPYATLMVGRLDDHLFRVMAKDGVSIDPGLPHWAGIAVFKRAHALFRERGYRATLLAAAYRHHLHWSELVGAGVVLTMPYAWWTQFEKSSIEVTDTLDRAVPAATVDALRIGFEDFRRAYDVGGLRAEEFVRYGPTVHTIGQFLGGYAELVGLVRERMLR
jgi:transaldolase